MHVQYYDGLKAKLGKVVILATNQALSSLAAYLAERSFGRMAVLRPNGRSAERPFGRPAVQPFDTESTPNQP